MKHWSAAIKMASWRLWRLGFKREIASPLSRGSAFGLLAMTMIWATLASAEVYITPEEAIRNIFPKFKECKQEIRTVEGQEFKVFTILSDGNTLGWAVALDEMGKVKPISFLVGIDAQGNVLEVYILEYRDLFGSEIKRKSFLKQFRGKSSEDQLKVGRDIDAVTGASISSRAAAAAVRKSLKIIEALKNG